jgi:hypothetical protein
MNLNIEQVNRLRATVGFHDGTHYFNNLHQIAIQYPYPWTVKVTEAQGDHLAVHFLRRKEGGSPFITINAGPMKSNHRDLSQIRQDAHRFVGANIILEEDEGVLGVDRIPYYKFEYIQHSADDLTDDLMTWQISFLKQDSGKEYQILCCFRPFDFDKYFNTAMFDSALESIRFLPAGDPVENLPAIFYYNRKMGPDGTYFCSACGTPAEHLDATCPNCSANREKVVWCQVCGFLNPFDLFFSNHHYCAHCGQLVSVNSGCFIATAVFEDENCQEVRYLRHFRDHYLIGNDLGKAFIRVYEHYGPILAFQIRHKPRVKKFLRLLFNLFLH